MDIENKYLTEIDGLLTEKEQSLKKKIFDLSKMESFVFSQPKLTSIYEKMAETGEEKYGYHYNETIMNMIFNDYVLNNPQMLTLYKAAIPKKKKRRDKSGINQLKNDMELKSKIDKKIVDLTQQKQQSAQQQAPKKENPIQQKEEQVDETTSASSSGAYAGPAAWSNKGDLSGDFKKNKNKMNKPVVNIMGVSGKLEENYNYLIDPSGFEEYLKELDDDLNIINEVIDPSMDFRKAEPSREQKIGYLLDVAEKNNLNDFFNSELFNEMDDDFLNKIYEKTQLSGVNYLKDLYKTATYIQNNPLAYKIASSLAGNIDEKAVSKSQQRLMGMVHAYQKGDLKDDDVSDTVKKMANDMKPSDVEDFAATKHKKLPEKVDEESMIDSNETTMANKSQGVGDNGGGDFVRGFTVAKTMNEDIDKFKKDIDLIEKYNQRLNNIFENVLNERPMFDNPDFTPTDEEDGIQYEIDRTGGYVRYITPYNRTPKFAEIEDNGMDEYFDANGIKVYLKNENVMNEERKPSAIVLKDRVGKENEKNFKKDFKQSDTKEIVDVLNDLEWKDQQEDVPKNPYKPAEDIEKEVLKKTKGEAFKNVGNSTNEKGDEAPKRNLTDDEQETVDMIRNGQHSLVYDNEPDKRFEDRMKNDMGDDIYKMRQKQMDFKAKAPTYNKDTLPTEKGDEKNQYNKEKEGWNNISENDNSIITGKYINDWGNTKIIDFALNEVEAKPTLKTDELKKIDFAGLGNTYDSKVHVNETVVKAIKMYDFYTDNEKIYAVVKSEILNENVDPKKNDMYNKMKHLMGYKPNEFVNTKKNKR